MNITINSIFDRVTLLYQVGSYKGVNNVCISGSYVTGTNAVCVAGDFNPADPDSDSDCCGCVPVRKRRVICKIPFLA